MRVPLVLSSIGTMVLSTETVARPAWEFCNKLSLANAVIEVACERFMGLKYLG